MPVSSTIQHDIAIIGLVDPVIVLIWQQKRQLGGPSAFVARRTQVEPEVATQQQQHQQQQRFFLRVVRRR